MHTRTYRVRGEKKKKKKAVIIVNSQVRLENAAAYSAHGARRFKVRVPSLMRDGGWHQAPEGCISGGNLAFVYCCSGGGVRGFIVWFVVGMCRDEDREAD